MFCKIFRRFVLKWLINILLTGFGRDLGIEDGLYLDGVKTDWLENVVINHVFVSDNKDAKEPFVLELTLHFL